MIEKEEFKSFVLEGWTVKELIDFYGISRNKVYELKKKWDLIGKSPNNKRDIIDENSNTKKCSKCEQTKPLTYFYSNGYQPSGKRKYKGRCKECENKVRYSNFISNINSLLLDQNKKYECERCGYNKNYAALCFHHIDPLKKEFSFSEISRTSSFTKLKESITLELDKCIVLCHNCHMEEHYPHLTI